MVKLRVWPDIGDLYNSLCGNGSLGLGFECLTHIWNWEVEGQSGPCEMSDLAAQ